MAKRVKAEMAVIQQYLSELVQPALRIRSWDVNEITCLFEAPSKPSVEIVISVPDEYPSGRPFCFSDSGDVEEIVTTANDFASQESRTLGDIIHKIFSLCCKSSGLDAPPPFADGTATTGTTHQVAQSASADDEDGQEVYDDDEDDYNDEDDDFFTEECFVPPPVSSETPAAEQEVEGVRRLMEKMRQTKDFLAQGGSVQATDRLMKEFRSLMKKDTAKDGYVASLVEDNLYEWEVRVFGFDPKEPIARDLEEYKRRFGLDYLQLHFKFSEEYPHKPPFVRVVRPGVQGGYVLDGGALCMELLTPMGWSSAYSIDAVIPQLMATLVEGKARIIMQPHVNYDERAARATFDYIVETHKRDGWYTPPKTKG